MELAEDQTAERLLRSCIPVSAVDAYAGALERAIADNEGRKKLVCVGRERFQPEDLRKPGSRLTDTHWAVLEALALVAGAPVVEAVVEALGCRPVLCFESFHMATGIAMRLHRESWYVRMRDRKAGFQSAWIALEDGAELQYLSHGLTGLDDEPSEESIAALGNRPGIRVLQAAKGDVLVLSGEMAVGGGPLGKWLCAHYCPLTNDPPYFPHLTAPYRTKFQWTRDLYLSTAYPGVLLRPAVTTLP